MVVVNNFNDDVCNIYFYKIGIITNNIVKREHFQNKIYLVRIIKT